MNENSVDIEELINARIMNREFPDRARDTQLYADMKSDLVSGFGSYEEYKTPNDQFPDTDFFERDPNGPVATRFTRQRAASYFLQLSFKAPNEIDSDCLDLLHAAIYDVSAAVCEDVIITLGVLARPESIDVLYDIADKLAERVGWGPTVRYLDWAIERVEREPNEPFEPNNGYWTHVPCIKQIGPDIVELVRDDKNRPFLHGKDGLHNIEISEVEAQIFKATSSERFTEYFLAEGGLEELGKSRLGAISIGLSHGVPYRDRLVTLTDTTTILGAQVAVDSDSVSPELLMDLSTFIYCCVMYDYVVLDSPGVAVPRELSEFVVSVRYAEARGVDPRWKIALEKDSELRRNVDLKAEVDLAWSDFLGRPVSISFDSFDSITDSPNVWGYNPANFRYVMTDPFTWVRANPGIDNETINSYASVQSYRYWINEKIAEYLGVSYNCTSLRFPVEGISLANRSVFRQAADSFLASISPNEILQCPDPRGYLKRVKLPNILALVLSSANSRKDIWGEVLRVRKEFLPVRESIRRQRLKSIPDLSAIESMLSEVSSKSAVTMTLDATLAASAGVAGASSLSSSTAATSLKVAATMRPFSRARDLLRAISRPEIRAIGKFCDEVLQVSQSSELIEKHWKSNIERDWVNRAASVTAFSSASFNRFYQ